MFWFLHCKVPNCHRRFMNASNLGLKKYQCENKVLEKYFIVIELTF